jgi:methionine-rich copper-binding protein CopC
MRSTSAVVARVVGVAVAIVVTVSVAQPADAHTDFDYSVPTDGASVGEPVSEVTVAFTQPVTLVGNGFEVFDPQQNVLLPFAVTDDDAVFRLQFDPPLAGGPVGVKYSVTAADGHVLSGSFSFTVSVDLPSPTTIAPTLPPATEPEPAPQSSLPTGTAPAESPPEVAAASEITAPPALVAAADEALTQPLPDESDGSRLLIWIAVAVAALAAVFLAVRARTSGGS